MSGGGGGGGGGGTRQSREVNGNNHASESQVPSSRMWKGQAAFILFNLVSFYSQ